MAALRPITQKRRFYPRLDLSDDGRSSGALFDDTIRVQVTGSAYWIGLLQPSIPKSLAIKHIPSCFATKMLYDSTSANSTGNLSQSIEPEFCLELQPSEGLGGTMAQVTTSRKVLRRFYELLLLLHALGQIRGERIKADRDTNSTSPNIQKLRRSFVDGTAYICAYEKGPRRVTAAALEQTPQGITVWLAANENIGEKVIQFLEKIFSNIQRIVELDDRESRQREGEQTLEDLTSGIVAFNVPRIQTYYEQVVH